MAHVAVTLEVFKKKVKDGAYENATAAKRALGRAAEMSDADKDAARAYADKHFGVEKTAPANKKKSTKSAGKKAPAKKTPTRRGAKKAPPKVAAKAA